MYKYRVEGVLNRQGLREKKREKERKGERERDINWNNLCDRFLSVM